MLLANKLKDGRMRHKSKPLLIQAKDAYVRPAIDFKTTTTIWFVGGLIKRRIRDWRRLTGEDGHSGERSILRTDTVFTGTYSVFPIPLCEYIIIRYAGEPGGKIIDPFAGGPPRAIASAVMGYQYHGFEVRQQQIEENRAAIKGLGIDDSIHYHHADGRFLESDETDFDFCLTCPPYFNVEVYSDHEKDISNFPTYQSFDAAMQMMAWSLYPKMKPGAFAAIVVGNFKNKEREIVDFRSDTIANMQDAGFKFWQDIILAKNIGSAAKRAKKAWQGMGLVSIHEHLLVFRKPLKDGTINIEEEAID